jgi:hypothetical protein
MFLEVNPMNWAENLKTRLQFFTIAMAFMCPGFLIWMAPTTKRQIESYSWPEAPGVVRSINAKDWTDSKGGWKYYGRVFYQYTVSDKEYLSDLTDLGPGQKRSDPQAALYDVRHYLPGQKVTVYYDPADPSIGIVEKGMPQIHQVMLFILTIGSVASFIGSVFVIRSWLQPKQTAPEVKPQLTST